MWNQVWVPGGHWHNLTGKLIVWESWNCLLMRITNKTYTWIITWHHRDLLYGIGECWHWGKLTVRPHEEYEVNNVLTSASILVSFTFSSFACLLASLLLTFLGFCELLLVAFSLSRWVSAENEDWVSDNKRQLESYDLQIYSALSLGRRSQRLVARSKAAEFVDDMLLV